MALSGAYTMAHGKIPEFFANIRDGQVPDQFTIQLLKDLGFKSNNHRPFIPIMKALGFLTPDGKPTQRYSDYRDHSQSKQVMATGIKEAYSDIFLIKENPQPSDKKTIEGKFKSYHNTSDKVAQSMAGTFYALLALADLNAKRKQAKSSGPDESGVKNETSDANMVTEAVPKSTPLRTGLHYNIQIHLPATKDIEVYNAIFKSLKEHLG